MTPAQFWRATKLTAMAVAVSAVCGAQPPRDDVTELKEQVARLQKQVELLSAKLERLTAGAPETPDPNRALQTAAPVRSYPSQSLTASTVAVPAAIPAAAPPAAASPVVNPPLPKPAPQAGATPPPSPLQIPIGNVTITPVGFMDLTLSWKDKNAGGSLGSNFGSVPYNNTIPQSKLSETRFSPQNSRLGFRVDGQWKGWRFIGYNEFDFLGTSGGNNLSVTNGAFVPRIRLYWVDTRKGKFEFLAGQSWSMLTPNRKGVSALPGDLFYSQVIDVNYMAGLTWTRQPGVRFLYHPAEKVTFGFSMENPDQYIGGSAGGSSITLPSAFTGLAGVQLDNQTNAQTIPNLHPDLIAKLAFDPSSRVHFEVAGIERTFKIYDNAGPNIGQYSTVAGGGGSINANFEVVKNFRLVTNNYWSDGGGRYLFGQAPDLVVRADGSISPVHSGGVVEGFEATVKNTLLYVYYGGIYIRRNVAVDSNGSLAGYGFRGAPNSQNKSIQEISAGFNQTLWKDARYGAINLMGQYEYLMRNPWYIAPNAPKATHDNTVYINIRYTLPGSAPTVVPK